MFGRLKILKVAIGGSGKIRHTVCELYSMLSLVCDFSEYDEIFRPEIKF